MLIYNNNAACGESGPFEAGSFAELAAEMRPTFEAWAVDAADDPDCEYGDTRAAFIARMVAEMMSEFDAGLNVVCPACGTHGPIGDESWSHTADECKD